MDALNAGTKRPPFDTELRDGALQLGIPIDQTLPLIDASTIDALRSTPVPTQVLRASGISRTDIAIPSSDGGSVEVSLLRGLRQQALSPGIVYFHPGGMMTGNRWSGITELISWISRYKATILTVEYRLAPEHPSLTPVHDCYAAVNWLQKNGSEHGISADHIIIVGSSAGGGLAAGVSLLIRDRGGPPLRGQMLLSPMLDDRDSTTSTRQFESVGLWDGRNNRKGWTALLGERRTRPTVSPFLAPARAKDLSNLPPAFIDCGSAEVLRDEAVAYASRVWSSGGRAELHIWPGGFHGFDGIVPAARLSQDATTARLNWLDRALQGPGSLDPDN